MPAALTVPTPGLYGVKAAVQRESPVVAGAVIAETPNVADRSFAPNCARPAGSGHFRVENDLCLHLQATVTRRRLKDG